MIKVFFLFFPKLKVLNGNSMYPNRELSETCLTESYLLTSARSVDVRGAEGRPSLRALCCLL